MRTSLKAVMFVAICGMLFISASGQPTRFPSYQLDRKRMTVWAPHADLGDVTLYKWAGALPDTVKDTLRFFARNALEFINLNELNRMHCVAIEPRLIDHADSMGVDVTVEMTDMWRDSLEAIYPEVHYTKLDLLSDSHMLFDSVSTSTFTPQPLVAIMEPEYWYLFDLWREGGSHMPYYCWFVAFYLDERGRVQHWVNSIKTYPAYGGNVKNL